MCPFISNWLQPDCNIKSMAMAALPRPEPFESQLIMEGCEYWREVVEYSKPPSSMLEYGEQLFLSGDNVTGKSYPTKKTDEKGSGFSLSDEIATKKLSHNANERLRRKNLNALYGKLRSLLPHSIMNMKEKVNNPAIVSGILKYIPQLQREIKTLSRQRDELLSLRRISAQALKISPAEYHASQMVINRLDCNQSPNGLLTEVNLFAMGQTLLVTVQTAHAAPLFSRLFLLFEEERLDVMNASTFISEENAWHSIQVKAMESSRRLDISVLRLKIVFLCENNCRSISGGYFAQKTSNCFPA